MDYDIDNFEEFCVANMAPVVPLTDEEHTEEPNRVSKLIQEEFDALDFNKEEDVFNESVEAAIVAISAGVVCASIGVIAKGVHDAKKAIKNYEKANPDVIPFKSLTKKIFNTKSFEDGKKAIDKNSEVTGKVKKFFKNICDGKKAYIWFNRDTPIIGCIVNQKTQSSTVVTTGTSTGEVGLGMSSTIIRDVSFVKYPGIGKKHFKYYQASICNYFKVNTNDCAAWVQENLKKSKVLKESVENTFDSTDIIIFEDVEEFYESNNGIDDDILPVVQELNSKGYKVKYSCSGHPSARHKNDKFRDGIYKGKLYSTARIIFDKKYDSIKSAPANWELKTLNNGENTSIYVKPPTFKIVDGLPVDAFNKWKAKYMNSLRSWSKSLPKNGSKETEGKDDIKKVEESVLDHLLIDTL